LGRDPLKACDNAHAHAIDRRDREAMKKVLLGIVVVALFSASFLFMRNRAAPPKEAPDLSKAAAAAQRDIEDTAAKAGFNEKKP
jgi:hypothetical protein